MKHIIKPIVFIALIIVSGYVFLMTPQSSQSKPENYTSTCIYVLKRRILLYAKENNQLPKTLDELPLHDGFVNRTTDVWDNEIMMKNEGTTVSLISYGKDKKLGGVGDNRDVIGIFDTKTPFGAWANEDTFWEKKPLSDREKPK
jgi:hypothetical protein